MSQAKKIVRLHPLTSANEMEQLMASLASINTKRAEINKLIFCRTRRGIRSKLGIQIFEKQRKNRKSSDERVDVKKLKAPLLVKRKHPPLLEIFHLPG